MKEERSMKTRRRLWGKLILSVVSCDGSVLNSQWWPHLDPVMISSLLYRCLLVTTNTFRALLICTCETCNGTASVCEDVRHLRHVMVMVQPQSWGCETCNGNGTASVCEDVRHEMVMVQSQSVRMWDMSRERQIVYWLTVSLPGVSVSVSPDIT